MRTTITLYVDRHCKTRYLQLNRLQGKTVAVIGNGSSGIQIVPGMLPKVERIDHYVRGRTWLSPTFARHEIDKRGAQLENCKPDIFPIPWTIH